MNSTESELRAMFDKMYKAWADGDAAAFADHYTDDATVVMPGVFHQGRDAVRESMAAGFAGPLKGSSAVDEPQDVRVHGDTAVIVSRAGILMAGASEVPAEGERLATWVLSKRDGRWLVSAYSNTPAH
ncbi:SgcJ/EcaC family oxidoreductase [Actinomadura syzygii]|uniref:SgcJ/EcaC family oxidoreductase n=1 Tax=Actinomadura syzygii TaxID=1427538 RepID=A0A5D0UAB9_9ACTN|nr:SgcJ/EcaC family oxidoreductase [Actinomadura syzygii]TYC14974.1 SgcJ/EcaC family oxidoreductase [Actinomadura syzygii]